MPATSVPLAAETMSGTQWPAEYGGSSHSVTKTRGEVSTAASAEDDAIEAALHSRRQVLRRARGAEPRAQLADRLLDAVQRRGGVVQHPDVQRTRAQRALDLIGRDRADVAELLHDDDVGLDLGPLLLLDRIQRPAVSRGLGDDLVDLGAREVSGLDQRRGDDRLRRRLRRPVALVGDADDLVPEAKREEHLGGRGNERADPHVDQATAVDGSCR